MSTSRRPAENKPGEKASVFSRRSFLSLSAGALVGWLTGCRRADVNPTATAIPMPRVYPTERSTTQAPTPSPTQSPTYQSPTNTPSPSDIATPSPPRPTPIPPTYTPVPVTSVIPPTPTVKVASTLDRAALMAHWPATATSRVVIVRHSGVWADSAPDPTIVQQMLDAGISALTDVNNVLAVWRTLFDPVEQILLKVNCIAYNGPTQPAVAYGVAHRLQDAGVLAQNVLIFDRTDDELAAAGYALNEGGAGVQCHGARGQGTTAALTQASVRFYQDLDICDAIINIPTPKQHGGAGVSVSLKNHYGSINQPGALHSNWCDPAIAELNAQPTVRDKTRLIVGAALSVSPCDWNQPERENALLFSFDPVALDTVARDILVRHRRALNLGVDFLINGARHLSTAQTLGLGATEARLIDLHEVVLG